MDTEKIGSFIAARRKTIGLTQQQLADEIGLTNKAVSKWETGQGMPDITLLPVLAEILGVKVDELLKGELLENKPEGSGESGYTLHKSIYRFRVAACLSVFFALIGNIVPFFMLKETSTIAAFLFGCWFELCSLAVFITFYFRMKDEAARYNRHVLIAINIIKIRNQFLKYILWLWLLTPSGLIVYTAFSFFSPDNTLLQLFLTITVTAASGILLWMKMFKIRLGKAENKEKE